MIWKRSGRKEAVIRKSGEGKHLIQSIADGFNEQSIILININQDMPD
ncbi:MAG: hypothetical protein OJF59_001631 [Cytophagales bacterium]|nr:MAG: hypothetical protein OJF59_001631 [Cytophagales bacterium]